MAKNLIIVESPSKAKTIKKYLGSNYTVKSSVGHIIDLPKSTLGIDLENDFKPKYITVHGKAKILKEIKDAAKGASKILLATDLDREGEAIAWHLSNALGLKEDDLNRIVFNEITETSIKAAVKNPRKIDQSLVDAQQARRVLDRIVGYKLSPLLWKKIKKGLSAGRVQSVTVQLIIDREKEIEAFIEEEYWDIEGKFCKTDDTCFSGQLFRFKGNKLSLADEKVTNEHIEEIKQKKAIVSSVKMKDKKNNPKPPFITSTLQQKAANVLNYTSKKTMQIAQELYEGIDLGKSNGGLIGLITYMRTDSTRISPTAKEETKEFIRNTYGEDYIPAKTRIYKISNKAQDAHEAVRPTSINRTPNDLKTLLTKDQYKLYKLIWERFLASEMPSAIYDQMTVEIEVGDYIFKSIGSKLKFKGYLIVGTDKEEVDNLLPEIKEGELLSINSIIGNQHFTQPPQRFTEATLIKKLESLGIGRPSTYASIMDTITKRGYVVREKKILYSTELGRLVLELLDGYFQDVINVKFTSKLENDLDLVADGKREWKKIIRDFYTPFGSILEKAELEIAKIVLDKPLDEVTDVICEKCGRNMVIKNGRFGKFLACPGFPECRNTKVLVEKIDVPCPNCSGEVVVKRSKSGRVFYGCSNYPDCNTSFWSKPINEKCPECGSILLDKGKIIACSNCKYKKEKPQQGEE
ncbi:MAG: type I DNA topoisomerase [Firmicutes bacterium]|nr:type I DNA topoisomerase [Bacillota bacterium]